MAAESWFPPLEQGARGYVHPHADELLQRWMGHLRKGSQQGLRFAQHQLAKSAKSSVLLQAEIEAHYENEKDFPYVHNLLQTVALAEDPSAVPLLLKVAKEAKVPVVRTAAVEALADLGAREAVPELFSLIESEGEAGPAGALHHALGKLGGKEVGDWFLQRFRLWLAGDPTMARSGQLAWSGLLGLSDDQAVWRLKSLPLELAKPFYAQALERRAALGDRTVGEELVSLLNTEAVPGPGVRSTALEGLVHLGDWEAVVSACSDPDPGVLSTAVQGLRQPAAHEGNWGAAQLEQLRHHPVEEIALGSLQALIERGRADLVEPFLLRAKEYPFGRSSVEAIHFLRQLNPVDPRLGPLLLKRWELCDDTQKLDLLRVFGQLKQSGHLALMEKAAAQESLEVRKMALTQLGNWGPLALDSLKRLREIPGCAGVEDDWVAAVASVTKSSKDAENILRELASDSAAEAPLRGLTLLVLPKILGGEALEPLWEARQKATSQRERAFIDGILREFF